LTSPPFEGLAQAQLIHLCNWRFNPVLLQQ